MLNAYTADEFFSGRGSGLDSRGFPCSKTIRDPARLVSLRGIRTSTPHSDMAGRYPRIFVFQRLLRIMLLRTTD